MDTGEREWFLSPADVFEAVRETAALHSKSEFEERVADYDYFLVTHFAELEQQPELLAQLDRYAVFAEGDGYILYDLHTLQDQDG